jgi:hypothetical protein
MALPPMGIASEAGGSGPGWPSRQEMVMMFGYGAGWPAPGTLRLLPRSAP